MVDLQKSILELLDKPDVLIGMKNYYQKKHQTAEALGNKTEASDCILTLIFAAMTMGYGLSETRRLHYKVSDEVCAIANRLKMPDSLPLDEGIFQVPCFLSTSTFSALFIPVSVLNSVDVRNSLQGTGTSRNAIHDAFLRWQELKKVNIRGMIWTCTPNKQNDDVEVNVTAICKEISLKEILVEAEGNVRGFYNAQMLCKKLSFLLKAQGAPIEMEEKRNLLRKMRKKVPAKIGITQYVKLAPSRIRYKTSDAEASELNKEGLVLAEASIVGHVRRQPCGPEGKERKLIFVAEHVGKRWCNVDKLLVVNT